MSAKNGASKINIAVIQEQIRDINRRLMNIEENHLPHLEERLDTLEKKIAMWGGAIIAITSLINILIKILK